MAYKIRSYTRSKAKQLGVVVKPSTNKKKKIDVFNKQGKKLASVGALGMNDYPTYMELEKKKKVKEGTAEKRRRLYKNRHESDRKKIGTNGYYADKLLW